MNSSNTPKLVAIGVTLLFIASLATWKFSSKADDYAYDPDNATYHLFSGDLAYAHVEKLVGFGPRPAGSGALEASRRYLEEQLIALGWATERQAFDDETPIGTVSFVNLRARFQGDRPIADIWSRRTPVLIGSHYDTKLYEDFAFVGANDGGSSTGALIEIARVTAKRPTLATQLELVFFDGEEAFEENITPTDGLYGSRYYARQARKLPSDQRPTHGLILDMIGDRNLNIGVPNDSPYKLFEALTQAAADLNYSAYFGKHSASIIDDHVPLNQIGIPTIDIIDLDYAVWHTAGDTMDQVSAESLRIVGSTALLFVEKYLLGELAMEP